MTRNEARRTLDDSSATIDENVRAYMAGEIDHAEFGRRNAAAHDAIRDAGQGGHWARRWRNANPIAPN